MPNINDGELFRIVNGSGAPSKFAEWKTVASNRKAASKTTYSDTDNANEVQRAIMAYVLTH